MYLFDPGASQRVELHVGVYLVFEPDRGTIESTIANFPVGMTWSGDPIDLRPCSERPTTGSAGLHGLERAVA
jgi:hypothetical protein